MAPRQASLPRPATSACRRAYPATLIPAGKDTVTAASPSASVVLPALAPRHGCRPPAAVQSAFMVDRSHTRHTEAAPDMRALCGRRPALVRPAAWADALGWCRL